MAKILKVSLIRPMPDMIHSFRNFGEEVYRALRDQTGVSIAEIDASVSEFYIRDIRTNFVRTAAASVRKLALKHGMSDVVVVEEQTT